MSGSNFRYEVSDVGDDESVVRVYGEIDLASASLLRDVLEKVAQRSVVVDMSSLEFLDSSGVTAIVSAHRARSARGQTLALRGASGIVRRVLEITGLTMLLAD